MGIRPEIVWCVFGIGKNWIEGTIEWQPNGPLDFHIKNWWGVIDLANPCVGKTLDGLEKGWKIMGH